MSVSPLNKVTNSMTFKCQISLQNISISTNQFNRQSMDDDGWLTKAEIAELLAGRRPDAPVTPAGTVPDWLNKAFDKEEERMRESKKRKVEEVEAPPAKRRRAAHGAVAGLTKQRAMEQREWEAKCAERKYKQS